MVRRYDVTVIVRRFTIRLSKEVYCIAIEYHVLAPETEGTAGQV